jgi:hypothetical protein
VLHLKGGLASKLSRGRAAEPDRIQVLPNAIVVDADGDWEPAFAELDSLLPLAFLVGEQDEPAVALEEALAARPDAPEIQLYWTGGLVGPLLDLCGWILAADPRPVRLQLGLSQLVRGDAKRVLLAIPKEVSLRLVAEDEYSAAAARAAQALLRVVRRERPRAGRAAALEERG